MTSEASNRTRTSTNDAAAEKIETQSRTAGVQDQQAGFWTKLIFWRAKRRYGHVPVTTRIRALDPRLLALSERMNGYTIVAGVAAPKLKELVQLKVAAMVGCPF